MFSSALPKRSGFLTNHDSRHGFDNHPIMEAHIHSVPTLQDLCFDSFYKQLLCKVTPVTVEFVRDCIHHQLMGSMRKTIRKRCIQNLSRNYFMSTSIREALHIKTKKEEAMFMLDICAVLDCVLDPTFSELDINVPNSAIKLFPAMMSVIARRSPELAKLEVEFSTIIFYYDEGSDTETILKIEVGPAVTTSQSQALLPSLTNLEISHSQHYHYSYDGSNELTIAYSDYIPLHDVDKPHQSILNTVAQCCPALTELSICCFHLRKRDFFALLLGEWNDILFPIECDRFRDDSVLKSLKIPSEFLSPLCFTLKELFLYHSDKSTPSVATFAFAMRHLSKLKSITDKWIDIAEILKFIHKKEGMETKQAEFEEFCRESALSTGRKRKLIGPFSFLSDSLSLTKLNKVLVDDVDTLRAIGSLCPDLRSITFIITPLSISKTRPGEVESILKNWPKVVAISIFEGVDSAYVKSILRALGPHLKRIEFHSCTQLDLEVLKYCKKLKHLVLRNCSFKPKKRGDVRLGRFLPLLEVLDSDTCLESWAPLFEVKRTLKDLTLNCCHIETEARLPRLEWSRMAKFWKHLKRLHLKQSTGLTTAILSDLLPHFKSLKRVVLPKSITETELELIQDLSKRCKKIRFFSTSGFKSCSYQQHA